MRGDQMELSDEAGSGDFIYLPPYVPHQAINGQPRWDLRSCGREGRTGSDCGLFRSGTLRNRPVQGIAACPSILIA